MDTRSITVTAVYALHRYSFFLKILKQNLWNKYFFPPQILLLMPSHLSVSYTHLDVYKRQVVSGSMYTLSAMSLSVMIVAGLEFKLSLIHI